ncbi:MAG: hypothetical protein Q7R43_04045, partial [Candidatus Daviesbacteria bacterium]|nr:hypothetical protein [Candidatus Daviesbacteria bacterium]
MTLTQIAIITKRGIIAVIALIFLSIVGAIGYRVWYDYYISTLPPVEEKPDLKFGSLSKIVFPKTAVSSANYSYSIDTETGSFPQMPKIIKVYFIPRANIVSLLAPDESQKLGVSFGFTLPREIVNPTNYKYADESNGSFNIDLTTGNFSYQKNIATSSATLNKTFTDQSKLALDFKEFLKSRGKLNDDLALGRTNVLYNKPIPSAAASAQISIWPSDFEGLEIVTPSFSLGLVQGNALNTEVPDRYSKVNYVYWQIDKNSFATYYLKPVDKAFAELPSGLGYVSSESPTSKVSIIKVTLAYFESEEYSPYLQPVYVFEGPNFKA